MSLPDCSSALLCSNLCRERKRSEKRRRVDADGKKEGKGVKRRGTWREGTHVVRKGWEGENGLEARKRSRQTERLRWRDLGEGSQGEKNTNRETNTENIMKEYG